MKTSKYSWTGVLRKSKSVKVDKIKPQVPSLKSLTIVRLGRMLTKMPIEPHINSTKQESGSPRAYSPPPCLARGKEAMPNVDIQMKWMR